MANIKSAKKRILVNRKDGTHPWPWYYAQAGINVHAGFVVEF